MEIYVSVDVESDGPIPGDYSMLQVGAAAFEGVRDDGTVSGKLLGTFKRNLDLLPGAKQHPATMKWWTRNAAAYANTRIDPIDPGQAMREMAAWLGTVCPDGRPIFVGYPAGYDFTFVHWYMEHFVGHDPFGFSAVDIKSYAMAVLKRSFKTTTKAKMPREWFPKLPHTHDAGDDALEQGHLWINILRQSHRGVGQR